MLAIAFVDAFSRQTRKGQFLALFICTALKLPFHLCLNLTSLPGRSAQAILASFCQDDAPPQLSSADPSSVPAPPAEANSNALAARLTLVTARPRPDMEHNRTATYVCLG